MNHGKNPSSAICGANTDIRAMYGRKGVNKKYLFVLKDLRISMEEEHLTDCLSSGDSKLSTETFKRRMSDLMSISLLSCEFKP